MTRAISALGVLLAAVLAMYGLVAIRSGGQSPPVLDLVLFASLAASVLAGLRSLSLSPARGAADRTRLPARTDDRARRAAHWRLVSVLAIVTASIVAVSQASDIGDVPGAGWIGRASSSTRVLVGLLALALAWLALMTALVHRTATAHGDAHRDLGLPRLPFLDLGHMWPLVKLVAQTPRAVLEDVWSRSLVYGLRGLAILIALLLAAYVVRALV